MARELPPLEVLDDLFVCEPQTGLLKRRRYQNGSKPAGSVVGTPNNYGHLICRVNYQICYVHRIIWKMVNRVEPPPLIDHKNVKPDSNQITNLRSATGQGNARNTKISIRNKSGAKGVSIWRAKSGKYKFKVGIKAAGKSVHIGYFELDQLEQASAAYRIASEKYHGEFGRIA